MSDKKIKIKVSELRKLIRETLEASPTASADKCSTCGGRGRCFTWCPEQYVTQDGDTKDDTLQNGKGKEQLNDGDTVVEFRSFDEDFASKITDKKYQDMAKQIFDAWAERGVDVDWAGVVNLFARNHSKNLGQEVDKTKLYEKVLDIVEKHSEGL